MQYVCMSRGGRDNEDRLHAALQRMSLGVSSESDVDHLNERVISDMEQVD